MKNAGGQKGKVFIVLKGSETLQIYAHNQLLISKLGSVESIKQLGCTN
jgi:hypothetical protein